MARARAALEEVLAPLWKTDDIDVLRDFVAGAYCSFEELLTPED